jgi:phosphatidylglycerol:prolipoprotein diacylglycerol transferase
VFPNLFIIPGTNFPVTTFGVMMFLAFVGGAWIGGKQAMRYGMRSELMWDTLAWVAVAGIVGAKLYFVALNWDAIRADPKLILDRAGLVWYGGLIGGVVAFGVQVSKRNLPVMTMYDAAAPALALAYALGRVGCFLVGDDYGRYTNSPVGVVFANGGIPRATAGFLRSLGDAVPRSIPDNVIVPVHPTQLYEVALALVILTILWHYGKKAHRTGQLFAAFLFMYSIERFFIEFVRLKSDRYLLGLSTSQIISIALFGLAGWLFWWRGKTAPQAPVVGGGPPPVSGTKAVSARAGGIPAPAQGR